MIITAYFDEKKLVFLKIYPCLTVKSWYEIQSLSRNIFWWISRN